MYIVFIRNLNYYKLDLVFHGVFFYLKKNYFSIFIDTYVYIIILLLSATLNKISKP